MRRQSWLTRGGCRAMAWGYLGFALIVLAPWEAWGWSSARPIPLAPPDKTVPAPLRLLNVMALAVSVFSSTRWRGLAELPAFRFLSVCGRHSLEVFAPGTVLAMIFRLLFGTYGDTLATQLLANGIGLGLMIALAVMLEHARHPVAAPRTADHLSAARKSVAHKSVV